jgi:hypothetical protein
MQRNSNKVKVKVDKLRKGRSGVQIGICNIATENE